MCLAIPGKIVEIFERDGLKMANVDYGGIFRETCLEYVPEAQVGEYCVVHVGFAISLLDEIERLLIDQQLKEGGLSAAKIMGYENEVNTHFEVGLSILSGIANVGITSIATSKLLGLDFIPITRERFDMVLEQKTFFGKNVQAFIEPPLPGIPGQGAKSGGVRPERVRPGALLGELKKLSGDYADYAERATI